jgi:hypothetical protein
MLNRKLVSLLRLFSCYAIGFFLCSQSIAAQLLNFEGRATEIDSGGLLYIEKHQVIIKDTGEYISSYVEYLDPEGQVFAMKTLDYAKSFLAPDLMFYDKRTKERITVFFNAGASYLSVLFENGAKREETMIKLGEPIVVVDAGFDRLIEHNWSALRKNKKIGFTFLALTRAQLINFEAIELESSNTSVDLELHPRNFFINMLVDPIALNYDVKTKRLTSFEGLTNIERFENGKRTEDNYLARIDYSYEPLKAYTVLPSEKVLPEESARSK